MHHTIKQPRASEATGKQPRASEATGEQDRGSQAPGRLRWFFSVRVNIRIIAIWTACMVALLAVGLYIFRDHWSGRASFNYDFAEGYYGIVAYWVTSMQSGEWPQWIPYQSMGYPALMNPQIGMFYPPFWIFVLLHIPYTLQAANIFQVLHVVFGAAGVLVLSYRLFGSLPVAESGAVAFLFFGGFYTNAEHPDFVRGFAWVPWLLAAALPASSSRQVKWRGRTHVTRLSTLNLWLPVFLACFVTGGYTGQMIAGMLILAVFIAAHSMRDVLAGADRQMILRDAAVESALCVLGVIMTAAFLMPEFALTRELTRAQGSASLPVWWMVARNWFDLIFPSSMVHAGGDYSMYGMQLPLTLWVFLGMVAWPALRKLSPFLAAGGAAIVMCFAMFRPVSEFLRRVIPPLGLSRFAAGEYREFFYLGLLLLTVAGLAKALEDREQIWRTVALAFAMLVLFSLVSITFIEHDLAPASLKPFLALIRHMVWPAVGGIAVCALASRIQKPWLLGVLLPVATIGAMLPVVNDMKAFWSDPEAVRNFYTNQGFSLTSNGKLITYQVFDHVDRTRPPRKTAANRDWLSWRGYLDGTYLTNDSGGSISLSRARVEETPDLFRFIQEENRLVAEPCQSNKTACSSEPVAVPVLALLAVGRSTEYGRNGITYELRVPDRSLIIENEIYLAGWHALCDGKPMSIQRVDGALRGWVVGPGQHRVKLYYQTPFLKTGLALSALAFLIWAVGLVFSVLS